MLMMDNADMMLGGSLGFEAPEKCTNTQTGFDMPARESGSDELNGAELRKKRGRRLKSVRVGFELMWEC